MTTPFPPIDRTLNKAIGNRDFQPVLQDVAQAIASDLVTGLEAEGLSVAAEVKAGGKSSAAITMRFKDVHNDALEERLAQHIEKELAHA